MQSLQKLLVALEIERKEMLTNNENTMVVASYSDTDGGTSATPSQLTDLYEDADVLASETTKPLTNNPNPHAPQNGVHLYQFPASFYSCEARLVLEEKGVNYEEHDVCIIAGLFDQYEPEYVRLNP